MAQHAAHSARGCGAQLVSTLGTTSGPADQVAPPDDGHNYFTAFICFTSLFQAFRVHYLVPHEEKASVAGLKLRDPKTIERVRRCTKELRGLGTISCDTYGSECSLDKVPTRISFHHG